MEQKFLDGFLQADAGAREAMIDETARQLHLAKEFNRYDKRAKLETNEHTKKIYERCKLEILKLMERS